MKKKRIKIGRKCRVLVTGLGKGKYNIEVMNSYGQIYYMDTGVTKREIDVILAELREPTKKRENKIRKAFGIRKSREVSEWMN